MGDIFTQVALIVCLHLACAAFLILVLVVPAPDFLYN